MSVRRANTQLDLEIVELLEKIPASTYAIAKRLKMTARTARSRLEFLEKHGKVKALREPQGTYWSLIK